MRIPQMGSGLCESSPAVRSERACVASFPVKILQGLLWVFATPDETLAASKKPALIPELDDSSFVDATDFFGPHVCFYRSCLPCSSTPMRGIFGDAGVLEMGGERPLTRLLPCLHTTSSPLSISMA